MIVINIGRGEGIDVDENITFKEIMTQIGAEFAIYAEN